jgi:UDP-3-O-[3-hydroxymyristoyl] glucosamine N-acyltransferase
LGDTVIGEGTKIDTLVQIGHNCRVGRNCLIAGTCALAGSTIVEDGVMFGGGSAATGHLTIGAGSVLAARTLVTKDLPAGSQVAGYPAQEMGAWRRGIATLRRLSKRTESGR